MREIPRLQDLFWQLVFNSYKHVLSDTEAFMVGMNPIRETEHCFQRVLLVHVFDSRELIQHCVLHFKRVCVFI